MSAHAKNPSPGHSVLAQAFWSHAKFDNSVSWKLFWNAFSGFVKHFEGLEITHKDFIEKNIKFIIDNDRFQTIQLSTVDNFFLEYWLNPLLRNYLLSQPIEEDSNVQFKQINPKEQQCVLRIIHGIEDKNKSRYLRTNDTITIFSNQTYFKYNE